uniref:Uncharacterized protein n=1 Tax=Nelumbo nucifera TaxID=4432 RepID=A0A822Z0A2_NELNU|nr:TPA_asm: hypothetical protein HUJ06_007762 [Nelumbo nucifera]
MPLQPLEAQQSSLSLSPTRFGDTIDGDTTSVLADIM